MFYKAKASLAHSLCRRTFYERSVARARHKLVRTGQTNTCSLFSTYFSFLRVPFLYVHLLLISNFTLSSAKTVWVPSKMYWDIIYITGVVLLRVFSWVCTAPLGYFCFQTSHLKLISTVFPSRNACTVCSVRCWIYKNSKRHSLLINIYTAVCRKLQIIGQCTRKFSLRAKSSFSNNFLGSVW